LGRGKDSEDLKALIRSNPGASPYRSLALAMVYQHLHKLRQSNEFSERGMSIAHQSGELDLVMLFEALLGENSAMLGRAQEAVRHAEEALRISQSLGDC